MPSVSFVDQDLSHVQQRERSDIADYHQLLAISPAELGDVDIAEMNLLCAMGLPGADGLDIKMELVVLDQWADIVRADLVLNAHLYANDPALFNNSTGYFKMLSMITVLQRDIGVCYNPDRIRDPDFTDSRDIFIHGLVKASSGSGHPGGTCVSMPVLYVAVGRRLGYPLKLATTKEHVFARWENGQDRFNIEATSVGLNTFSDDYYKEWPHTLTKSELASGSYLRSLGPDEELALSLAVRGYVLEDTGRHKEALEAYTKATQLDPVSIDHARSLARLTRRMTSQADPDPANPVSAPKD